MEKQELIEQIEQAEKALHLLQMGEKEYSVNISGFGNVTFVQANSAKLERYIVTLKQKLTRITGGPRRSVIYPSF